MGTALGTDLATKRDQLLAATQRLSAPLELSAFLVRGEPVAIAEASRGRYAPFDVGESWGPPWSTTWFHIRGRVPSEWSGQNVVAVFDIGFEGRHTGFTCEALAWHDGRPWRGVDPNHRWLPITSPDVDFYLEASAIPTAVVSGPADAPSMIARRASAAKAFGFRQPDRRCQDPAARKMALDFKTLYELAGALPDGDRRSAILEALDRFAKNDDAGELEAVLSRPSNSPHAITAVGHAHIDTAWLWPL